MKKPTFFLSSTIYDFADLRSSLKFFLEQQGCRVLASEFNDFTKSFDTHSYQACLDTINEADYFVLLIGSRVGGWFDIKQKISITQREYREAYKLHQEGKLKIISFIRSEIWNLREDRNALKKYIESLDDLSSELKRQIVNHPGKSVSDANFIINFIEEVGKNQETKNALSEATPFPTGNWLHIFKEFKDIFDVLQAQIFLGKPLNEAVIRKLLHRELSKFLKICLVRGQRRSICSPTRIIQEFHQKHFLTSAMIYEPSISVNIECWDKLCSYVVHLQSIRLHPVILPQALSSPFFLEFDVKTGMFVENPVYEALERLSEELQLFQLANKFEVLNVAYKNSPQHRGTTYSENIDLHSLDLWTFLHLMDRWSNLIELCKAIITYLENNEFVFPKLRGRGVSEDTEKELEEDKITEEELRRFFQM